MMASHLSDKVLIQHVNISVQRLSHFLQSLLGYFQPSTTQSLYLTLYVTLLLMSH